MCRRQEGRQEGRQEALLSGTRTILEYRFGSLPAGTLVRLSRLTADQLFDKLSELLGKPVAFASDTVGDSAQATVAALEDGDVAVLENVRFNEGETSKDDAVRGAFADQLAALADAFVSDGFGVVHRKQASVYDVAQRLPSAMGGLVAKEIGVLRRLTVDPERPYVVVLGGSKVSDKLGVIEDAPGSYVRAKA